MKYRRVLMYVCFLVNFFALNAGEAKELENLRKVFLSLSRISDCYCNRSSLNKLGTLGEEDLDIAIKHALQQYEGNKVKEKDRFPIDQLWEEANKGDAIAHCVVTAKYYYLESIRLQQQIASERLFSGEHSKQQNNAITYLVNRLSESTQIVIDQMTRAEQAEKKLEQLTSKNKNLMAVQQNIEDLNNTIETLQTKNLSHASALLLHKIGYFVFTVVICFLLVDKYMI